METERRAGLLRAELRYARIDDILAQGLHAYLKQHGVAHVWHVDGHAHDAAHWRSSLHGFVQRLFR